KYLIIEGTSLPKDLFHAERYVIKAIGENIIHKTEVGAVVTNIEREDVAVEIRRMYNRLTARKYMVDGFLVQEHVPKGIEIIIGAKRDKQFGEVVLFGLGGVNVELYKDVSVRLCPISTEDALDMIRETKADVVFDQFRGGPKINRNMVAEIMKRICSIMHKNKGIREIDLNPVVVYENSYYAVDVRVVR
ncbi:MAG: acetate--CoA ligase family protein, partial [Candidatus Micrarchaeia archaeon]